MNMDNDEKILYTGQPAYSLQQLYEILEGKYKKTEIKSSIIKLTSTSTISSVCLSTKEVKAGGKQRKWVKLNLVELFTLAVLVEIHRQTSHVVIGKDIIDKLSKAIAYFIDEETTSFYVLARGSSKNSTYS